jgi:hypothetical protein
VVKADQAEAERLARVRNQLAYFDLGKKETVNVHGKG